VCKSKGPTKPAGKVKASDGGEAHSCAPSDPSLIWPARKSCWADGLTVLRCSVVSQAPGSHQTLTCVCLASTVEHACYDPKDSELCLARVKPQETGVEARSRCDVQIHGSSWA